MKGTHFMSKKDTKNHQKELFEKFKSGAPVGKNKTLTREWQGEYDHTFDFKYLMEEYYRYYNEPLWENMWKEWEKWVSCDSRRDPRNNSITLWYTYKKIDDSYQKETKRSFVLFDCDSWNNTNDLLDKIYDLLWRDPVIDGLPDIKENFGPDTMNSFAYTFNALANTKNKDDSFCKYIEALHTADAPESADALPETAVSENTETVENKKTAENKEAADRFSVLEEYAAWTGCLGNFILVPKEYNRYRGSSPKLQDYWDLSLHNLRPNTDGREWLGNADMTFKQYINIFFLWDYVDKTYHVRPLFPSHMAMLQPEDTVLPHKGKQQAVDEFKIFTDNVNIRIERRGIFMAAMLRIADTCPRDYREILKALSAPRCLGTMEEVLEKLRSNDRLSPEAKGILKDYALDPLRQVPLKDEKETP